jgi:hypothetical protein
MRLRGGAKKPSSTCGAKNNSPDVFPLGVPGVSVRRDFFRSSSECGLEACTKLHSFRRLPRFRIAKREMQAGSLHHKKKTS